MKRLNMLVVLYARFNLIPFEIKAGMNAMSVSEPS